MKTPALACVVFSDYPIKTMAYQRFLSGLGEERVHLLRSLDSDISEISNAKLVICDMNIMEEMEERALSTLEENFPKANILFLEEDHSDMRVKFSNQRDICRLGKLAEINVIHSTLKELLLQVSRKPGKSQRSRKERMEQT
jgi:hypothetical protein